MVNSPYFSLSFPSQILSDTSVLDCHFRNSVVHGLARKIEMKKFREFRRQLTFYGGYKDGRPAGPCWEYREGGGFVFGCPDIHGKFTGNAYSQYFEGKIFAARLSRDMPRKMPNNNMSLFSEQDLK